MILDIAGIIALAIVAWYIGNTLIVIIMSNLFSSGEGLSDLARAVPLIIIWTITLVCGTLLYIGSWF